MNILAIMGSPRKNGSSYELTRLFEKKLKTINSNINFNYLFLKDCNLKICNGCFNCLFKGEQFCPHKDDRDKIYKMMDEADGLIFVSPVYAINISSYMKIFLDRFAYLWHRPAFFAKTAMGISTVGAYGLKQVLQHLADTDGWGLDFVYKLGLSWPVKPYKLSKKLQKKVNKKVEKAAKVFHKKLIKKIEYKPTLIRVIQFYALKHVTAHSKETSVADYEYYKDKNFYVDKKVNFLKKFIGNIIGKIAVNSLNKNYIKN